MATVEEVVKYIHQAAMNAQDLSKGIPEGIKPTENEAGLKIEDGHQVKDSREADGFRVGVHGDTLVVTYQGETSIKEVHENKFEENVERRLNDIARYIREEFKKLSGESLKLEDMGQAQVRVTERSISYYNPQILAQKQFEIGNIESYDFESGQEERKDIIDDLEVGFKE